MAIKLKAREQKQYVGNNSSANTTWGDVRSGVSTHSPS